jgi:ABC-type phosphate transport system substrate-binding protein
MYNEKSEFRDLRDHYDARLMDRVYSDILKKIFLDVNELEPQQAIAKRLKEKKQVSPQPETHLIVSGEDLDGDPKNAKLDGVVVLEIYTKSGVGLVTYLAVLEHARQKGLGKELFDQARRLMNSRNSASILLAEVHKREPKESITPARFEFFRKMGGAIIPINYVQPALSKHSEKVRSLVLMAFSTKEENAIKEVDCLDLISFFEEFYLALETPHPWRDDDFRKIWRDLSQLACDEPTQFDLAERQQQSGFHFGFPLVTVTLDKEKAISAQPTWSIPKEFSHWAVSFHYQLNNAVNPNDLVVGSDDPEFPNIFSSFERDFLAHAFRDKNLINTQAIRLGEIKVRVDFPAILVYEAEGTVKYLWFEGGTRRVEFNCGVACTFFQPSFDSKNEANGDSDESKFNVLHVVLSGNSEANQSGTKSSDDFLSEYELIQLCKLWEGGEGLGQNDKHAIRSQLGFCLINSNEPKNSKTFNSLEQAIAEELKTKNGKPIVTTDALPLCGSVQLNPLEDEDHRNRWKKLFSGVQQALGSEASSKWQIEEEVVDHDKLKAFAGVMQGLVDFFNIGRPELLDVFKELNIEITGDDTSVLVIHKGTLLYFLSDCRLIKDVNVQEQIGINPYLLIAHSLLVYHELLLREAFKKISSLKGTSKNWPWCGLGLHPLQLLQRVWLVSPRGTRISRGALKNPKNLSEVEVDAKRLLQYSWLPNLYHYRLGRYIYDLGHTSRGLLVHREQLLDQISFISAKNTSKNLQARKGFAIAGSTVVFLVSAFGLIFSYLSGAIDIGGNIIRMLTGIPPWEFGSIKPEKITINGSRLLYPLIRRIADQYEGSMAAQNLELDIKKESTTIGFQEFCLSKIDVVTASREIDSAEKQNCIAEGVHFHMDGGESQQPFPIATDTLVILVKVTTKGFDRLSFTQLKKIENSDVRYPLSLKSLGIGGQDAKIRSCDVAFLGGKVSSRREFFDEMVNLKSSEKQVSQPNSPTSFFQELYQDPDPGNGNQCTFAFASKRAWGKEKENGSKISKGYREIEIVGDQQAKHESLTRTLGLYVSSSRIARSSELRRFLDYVFDNASKLAEEADLQALDPKAYAKNSEVLERWDR